MNALLDKILSFSYLNFGQRSKNENQFRVNISAERDKKQKLEIKIERRKGPMQDPPSKTCGHSLLAKVSPDRKGKKHRTVLQ